MTNRTWRVLCGVTAAVALLCVVECSAAPGDADELAAMEAVANQGRESFFKQDYRAAAQRIEPLAEKLNANKPLYECELASIALLSGDTEKARGHLREAILLLEGFFDEAAEKSAASTWGNEIEKVYKGDPYERALLYAFYGMTLLERGEPDNALAAFKRALLMSGDMTVKSNFGFVQLLAAKCHNLLGELEMRDRMLMDVRMSITLFLNHYKTDDLKTTGGSVNRLNTKVEVRQDGFSRAAQAEYDAIGRHGGTPSQWVAAYTSWGHTASLLKGKASDDVIDWLQPCLPKDKGLGFNTMVVVWNGRGPSMERADFYNEKRVLAKGKANTRLGYSAEALGGSYDNWPWLGNITHLAKQPNWSGINQIRTLKSLDKFSADIKTSLLGTSSSTRDRMTIEADIRGWRCLPHELVFIPLTLPTGKHEVIVTGWEGNFRSVEKTITVDRKPGAAVTFAHITLPEDGDPLKKLQAQPMRKTRDEPEHPAENADWISAATVMVLVDRSQGHAERFANALKSALQKCGCAVVEMPMHESDWLSAAVRENAVLVIPTRQEEQADVVVQQVAVVGAGDDATVARATTLHVWARKEPSQNLTNAALMETLVENLMRAPEFRVALNNTGVTQ